MQLFIREQIKVLLAQECLKLKELAEMITEKTGKKCSPNALSKKLNRGTMTYNEAVIIACILGYKIQYIKEEEQ
jgi:hypothetical protein